MTSFHKLNPTFSASRREGKFSGRISEIRRAAPKPSNPIVAASPSCLRSLSPTPQIAAHVVTDLNLIHPIHRLPGQTAITHNVAAGFQNHGPEPMAVIPVAPPVTFNPRFNSGSIP
jgi:hypothetical protein